MVVVFVQNFGGDIVGCAQLLVKISVGIIDERGTEINDLDLVELLVGLKKDVFGL